MTTRADMADQLSLSPSAPTKTFVLEVHAENPVDFLGEVVGSTNLESTKDAYLFRAYLPDGVVWIDQLDERFWTFHSDMPIQAIGSFLHKEVEKHRELDWIWLPSDHLRDVWPNSISRRVHTTFNGRGLVSADEPAQDLKVRLSGRNAEQLLEYIAQDPRYRSAVSFESVQSTVLDQDLGRVDEGISRMGRFAVSGDSFEFHLQFVRAVVERYRKLVTLCESKAISYTSLDSEEGGGSLSGGPISIRFSRPIDDISSFTTELFSARQPFRLWGSPRVSDSFAEVDAVDLHVGASLRMDIGTNWLRIYLDKGSCGNTVARLVSNLQHAFDGALEFVDPELQAALKGDNRLLQSYSN